MLYQPDRHEPLCAPAWDEAEVRRALSAIVRDLEAHRGPDGLWPPHALDIEEGEVDPRWKSLYLGAAGVAWALWHLEIEGACRLAVPPAALIAGVYEAYLAAPDVGEITPSWFLGEAGILATLWRLTGDAAAADRLAQVVEANRANPTLEALWGAPGTMVAAAWMARLTGEARWGALFRDSAQALLGALQPGDGPWGRLWIQDLYGRRRPILGAGHGFAGNVFPLLLGADLLDPGDAARVEDLCAELLAAQAVVEGGPEGARVNWPRSAAARGETPTGHLVQWCHGAPGVVTSLSPLPPGRLPEVDALLLGAGALTWQAGPLTKGPGICHGTAGNGYAFLALHRRTGDPRWLHRARAFAMHALRQSQAMRRAHGRPRCTLWTGDAGLAVYLWGCVRGEGEVPGLGAF